MVATEFSSYNHTYKYPITLQLDYNEVTPPVGALGPPWGTAGTCPGTILEPGPPFLKDSIDSGTQASVS